jgi:hypothetical protein
VEKGIVPISLRFVTIAVNLLLLPSLSASLDLDDFSKWMVIMSILGFSSFLDMGVGTTFRIVFHKTEESDRIHLYEEMQRKLFGIAIIFMVALIVSAFFVDLEFLILPFFLVIGIVPKSTLAHLYVVEKSYTASTYLFLPSLTFAGLAIIILYFFSLTVSQLSLLLGFLYAVIYLVGYFYYGQESYFNFHRKSKTKLLSFRTNISFISIQAAASFLVFIPGWFALTFLQSDFSATFQIHWKLLTLVLSIFSIINSRYLNLLAARANKKFIVGAPNTSSIYLIAIIFGLVVFAYPLVANRLILLWMGGKFIEINIVYFSLAILLFIFSGITSNKLMTSGRINILLIVALFQVLLLALGIVCFDLTYLRFSQLYMVIMLIGYLVLSSFTRLYEAKII